MQVRRRLSPRAPARLQVLTETSPSVNRRSAISTSVPSPRTARQQLQHPQLQNPQSVQPTPDMDQLRLLAYQERQKQRRNRVITPNMLKSRPVETKQNVVMRSKHKSSEGSVTSEMSHRSDITEKTTNNKRRVRRNQASELQRLETLESVDTFESLKNDAENKMAMANTMLADAAETKRKAQLEIAKERERSVAERQRYEALASEAEAMLKAQAEAAMRIQSLEAEQKRREQEHQAALMEAKRKAAEEALGKARMEEEAEKKRHQALEQKLAAEAKEKQKAQAEAAERIMILEAEQKRLDQDYKAAKNEAERQAQIAADEENRRLEYEQLLSQREEECKAERQAAIASVEHMRRLEAEKMRSILEVEALRQRQTTAVDEKSILSAPVISAGQRQRILTKPLGFWSTSSTVKIEDQKQLDSVIEAKDKQKAYADAVEKIKVLEAEKNRLEQECKAAMVEAQRQAQNASLGDAFDQLIEQHRSQLEAQLRSEAEKQGNIASAEQMKRLEAEAKRLKLEVEAQREAQIAAAEEKKRLEAESRRHQLEVEAQKQAQIAANEEKIQLEAAFEELRIETEKKCNASAEQRKRLEAEKKRLQLEEEALSLANIAATEEQKRLEAETRKLQLKEEAQKQAQIAAADETKRLQDEQMRLTLETQLRLEYEQRAESPQNKQIKKDTHSCSGFFVSEGVSDCSSEEDEIVHSNSTTEAVEVELPSSQISEELEGEITIDRHEGRSSSSSTGGRALQMVGVSEPLKPVQEDNDEDREAIDDDDQQVGGVKKEKSKNTRKFFKSLLRGKTNKQSKIDKEEVVHASDIERTSVSRVKQLELELLELSKEIARTKDVAASLSRGAEEREKPSQVRKDQMEEGIEVTRTLSDAEFISVYTPITVDESAFAQKPSLLQRTGSLIKRRHLLSSGSFTKMSKEEKELLRRAKAMAKADNHFQETFEVEDERDVDCLEPIAPTDAATALADRNAANGFQDTFDVEDKGDGEYLDPGAPPAAAATATATHAMVEDGVVSEGSDDNYRGNISNDTFSSENGIASFIDERSAMYDEEIAALVSNNTSDSLDYENEDVDEFITPPGEFIHIPVKRRVPSREMGIQTQTDSMSMADQRSVQVISPRPINANRESLFESAALCGATACMGASRGILSCADTCNEYNPDSRVHEALERTSSQNSQVYGYNPNSPQGRSMFRCGKDVYSQEEEDLVTRAFVNALHRVDTALHSGEEGNSPRGVHSGRRQSGRHSTRRVNYSDIMSIDGKFVDAREHANKRKERVPRNLTLKPKMQTPRGGSEESTEEKQELAIHISLPKEKKTGFGKKMLKGFKRLANARIVYDDA